MSKLDKVDTKKIAVLAAIGVAVIIVLYVVFS